ncbi:alpha/beta hydrolase [Mycobacterium conspicuum]|uniref:Alpha/beta hydrolase n=1 Tax=Mycobacterium conspicuum TaxID=44010 RepID=A0A1X1TNX0_9MYCO|nr:alpha/beta hydrolase [Mycobacterium conspicuum]ORV46281.1 alpha/beta hydrolase [Mycobacterium conspicuum]BBZ37736.1 alpha/beta hydrolase [Mycobacterium conspicuum]
MTAPLGVRTKAAVVRSLFALPAPVRRLLAGPPMRIDGQELARDAQLAIRVKNLSGATDSGATIENARAQYERLALIIGYESPAPIAAREVLITADHGDIPATLYTTADLPEPSGLLVYYHGGGFTMGSRASHDPVARFLAYHAGVRVLSVEYRRAPEHRFPAAVEDAITAFGHAHRHAADLGADPDRIAVGGDSAGGNLAAVTAQQAAQRCGAVPAFQLLMYPPTDIGTRRPSRELFGQGSTITEQDLDQVLANYLPPGTDLRDPRLSPLHGKVGDLAPAYIATAGFDPLRDDGQAYADTLRSAGVPVVLGHQPDLPHGYLNLVGLGGRFAEAAAEAAAALRAGLKTAAAGTR